MTRPPDIFCIGSVLWAIIGRSASAMRPGSDLPGRITRAPGGVALNIALTHLRFGLRHGSALDHALPAAATHISGDIAT